MVDVRVVFISYSARTTGKNAALLSLGPEIGHESTSLILYERIQNVLSRAPPRVRPPDRDDILVQGAAYL